MTHNEAEYCTLKYLTIFFAYLLAIDISNVSCFRDLFLPRSCSFRMESVRVMKNFFFVDVLKSAMKKSVLIERSGTFDTKSVID